MARHMAVCLLICLIVDAEYRKVKARMRAATAEPGQECACSGLYLES